MVPKVAMLVLAAPAEMPPLSELKRFPNLATANAQIGALIRIRYFLGKAPQSRERDEALRFNASQLLAWELLLEAHGGFGIEEGGCDDEEACRAALGRLRKLLGEKEWRAGRCREESAVLVAVDDMASTVDRRERG